MAGRIDTHHHVVPDFYRDAIISAGGDPSGWGIPEWTVQQTREDMDVLQIEKAYLSVTAPGAKIYEGLESRAFARRLNDYVASLVRAEPNRFGMFASLPNLTDVEGTLEEIRYAHSTLGADGFTVFTSYGDEKNPRYLGHETFGPIWAELNRLRTVAFVHPSHAPSNIVNRYLPQPGMDYPHETARTAADLVTSGTRRKFPDIKIILSHGGGTLPVLGFRIASVAAFVGCPLAADEIMRDFKSFYYDVALATETVPLTALLGFADRDKILYGSDVPYAPVLMASGLAAMLEAHCEKTQDEELLKRINRDNAKALFRASHCKPKL